MTDAADLVLLDGEIHTLCDPDETHEAMAVRDGRIVRLGSTYDVEFLVGTKTETFDLAGDVVLPGFVDAHTHLDMVGRSLVHADLSDASGPDDCVDRLRERLDELESDGDEGWVLGFGYDESGWIESRYLTCEDLDSVSTDRPVAAFREDMHVVSVNSVALDRHLGEMPTEDVRFDGDEPTGVVVEKAVDAIYEAVEPGVEETGELLRAAQAAANERGVTGVHDMTRNSHKPRVYREMDAGGELTLRVRLNYWADHLDSVIDAGLRTNHGSEMVRTGAIKTFTDGSFGGRTAKLSEPYSDDESETGTWVVDPDELGDIASRADSHGLQLSAHAIGDEAVDAVLDAYENCENPGESRHRIEHAELADDEAIERFAESGVVASVQPNFLKWAEEGGLYASRLGDRRTETNRYAALADADVPLAFGSDCMPLDPLLGVHWAVNAPAEEQRLSVTDALRAYTSGAAYAGFDEDRLGTLEVGKVADLTVLAESPWEADAIRDVDVSATFVDGRVVYREPRRIE
ncbi:tim-barrel fold metal-dependent hydrolase [Halogeometricum pallidum JCM 14848]|uniref:Tim-barrel fold metal-dependent hydrolase n=1 Tax=Halogeometricum pallidum JCM 14848 TaxID=1227487 RepID=M0DFI2_HALPD|nr:amidohydrolase [Halogeometricum pallidum]ELZ33538.1 tim-barrel fold metal-dependent hydrolase [Halogeometricum pallidum JCM 14848]